MLIKQELSPEARQAVVSYNAIFKQLGLTERYRQSLSARIEEYMRVGGITVGISEKISQYQAAKNSDSPITVIRTELPSENHGASWLFSLVRLNLGDGSVEPGSMVAVGHRDHVQVDGQEVNVTENGKGEFTDEDVGLVAKAEEHLIATGSDIYIGPSGLDDLI
jgi:hypothetical protein